MLSTFLRLISVPAINIRYKKPNSATISKRCSSCKKPMYPKIDPTIISIGVVGSFKNFATKGENIIISEIVMIKVTLSLILLLYLTFVATSKERLFSISKSLFISLPEVVR